MSMRESKDLAGQNLIVDKQLAKKGWKIRKILPDGNCLFETLRQGIMIAIMSGVDKNIKDTSVWFSYAGKIITHYPFMKNARLFRAKMCDYLNDAEQSDELPEWFSPIVKDEWNTWDNYITTMRKNGKYGGEFIWWAVTEIFPKLVFEIYEYDAKKKNLIKQTHKYIADKNAEPTTGGEKKNKENKKSSGKKRGQHGGGKKKKIIVKKTKKPKKILVKKIVRKHRGIVQIGGNKGRLRKGYKYTGKKLKSGLPQIIKCRIKI